ncbi:hypothetical protein T310_7146 [Rasamsonia emersonii CBS 393.64]|uniref:Uncharacterized protein n=1 Tax=Rasamsonia emersonii (strain ATCC 16479 / CBS 393.64 / IMI 116815) TaxID=1408163 RepID=A0A0F4YM15_RASE3|nr:hypothetical protein T310_7146 [Rasamsonia emersonii CBS 393.64]KKA18906.1 hypothetical protein T310_7146 [Rasamsonia emersonii CBS 393.64]
MVGIIASSLTADRSKKPTASRVRDSSWADGLRGIASVFVVSSHVTLCFARYIVPPALAENGPSALFQRPFLRLVGQGNAWVAVFFVLLGFVNSLKTVQLARVGAVNDALNSLASSTFRRTGRLVFPATAVTILAWFFCQLGAFNLATRTDAYWVRTTSPRPSASWVRAIDDLIRQLISTWVYGENAYDQPQWALINLFKGSFDCRNQRVCRDDDSGIVVIPSIAAEVDCRPCDSISVCDFGSLPLFVPRLVLRAGCVVETAVANRAGDLPAERPVWALFSRDRRADALLCDPLFAVNAQCAVESLSAVAGEHQLPALSASRPVDAVGDDVHGFPAGLSDIQAGVAGGWDAGPGVPHPGAKSLDAVLGAAHLLCFLLVVVRLWAVKVEPYFGAATDAFERFARSWGKESSNSPKQNGSMLPTFVAKD